jgi:hypothetical protein
VKRWKVRSARTSGAGPVVVLVDELGRLLRIGHQPRQDLQSK